MSSSKTNHAERSTSKLHSYIPRLASLEKLNEVDCNVQLRNSKYPGHLRKQYPIVKCNDSKQQKLKHPETIYENRKTFSEYSCITTFCLNQNRPQSDNNPSLMLDESSWSDNPSQDQDLNKRLHL
ncbi:hypothetical protein M9H77_09289 [Catharanthus roseus]|uniref:Uncharacterized protein n=1 Tax=Catharanthus roseus TaxID=4058 RepID=A0ACC0C0E0_CATRO|nr:hypothetical protein M9H77_09289 [Catharanthus roseus]